MTLAHLRVLDSGTNLPVPFRLRMVHANGTQACPLGKQLRFPLSPNRAVGGQALLGDKVYHWIDGNCEVMLEPGNYWVEVSRGSRYVPQGRWVEVKPGQAALRILLDPAQGPWGGWILGDGRCHGMSTAAAGLEGAGNGMDLVHLLAWEHQADLKDPADLSSLLQYSGQAAALNHDGCEVYVNTLNSNPILGAISILNSHRVVFPLTSCTPEFPELWSVIDWCQQGHRKGGLVSWVLGVDEVKPLQGEALAAVILGQIDTIEISSPALSPLGQLRFWYLLLNAGIKIPILGASGKDSNKQTIASLFTACQSFGGATPHQQWVESSRKGQSFVSSGPFLHVSKSDQSISEFVCHHSNQQIGQVLQWVLNGEVIQTQSLDAGEGHCAFQVPADSMGWLVARIVDLSKDEFVAHSNPFYLGGMESGKRIDAIEGLLTRLRETSVVLSRGEYYPVKFKTQILSSLETAKKRLIMES